MVVDTIGIHAYHEADLARKLGYVLLCRLSGSDTDYPISAIRCRDTQSILGNLEVKTIQGWKFPVKCWGVLVDGLESLPEPTTTQQGLFG